MFPMARRSSRVFLLLLVLSVFWCGCGGFNGVLAPTLSSITPDTVAAGSADFSLTASGSNFGQGTTLLWNGISLPTTVTSSSQLTAKVSAAQIASSGTVSIRVLKADSTTSGTLSLTVTGGGGPGGSFALTSISPSAVAAGSGDFTLTAIGNRVYLRGIDHPERHSHPHDLRLRYPASRHRGGRRCCGCRDH